MNYIRQLSAFFEKVSDDYRLNPSHVSLYMALFQFWNLNRFENPISISREQTLKLCKIGSNHTYHKCLHDLHNFGYIVYKPSHNPIRGSLIYLCIFDTSSEQVLHQFSDKNETSTAQALHSSINNINILNNKKRETKKVDSQNLEIENLSKEKNEELIAEKSELTAGKKKREKVPVKREKFIPPEIDLVIEFFKNEKSSEIDAKKFFHHFESNGWKVGGKTPMKNWNAAARKWILNSCNFFLNKTINQKTENINPNGKDYSKPL